MKRIKLLSKQTVDKIAAGEVIINGASVVKELVENAIDAGSTRITVTIRSGGKELIKVSDNGHGIYGPDIDKAFMRNATSKLNEENIENISTLGFRGEALASICAVAKVTVLTKTTEDEIGCENVYYDSSLISSHPAPTKTGTIISVENLFYNFPARFKHLKKQNEETSFIIETMSRLAVSCDNIAFELICDNKTVFMTDGSSDRLKTITGVYGRLKTEGFVRFAFENDPLKVECFADSPSFIKDRDPLRLTILNGRVIESKAVSQSIDSVYFEIFGKRGAGYVMFISLPYNMIDVNIHPAKTTVGFLNESLIMLLIRQGIKEALSEQFVLKNRVSEKSSSLYEERSEESENLYVAEEAYEEAYNSAAVINNDSEEQLDFDASNKKIASYESFEPMNFEDFKISSRPQKIDESFNNSSRELDNENTEDARASEYDRAKLIKREIFLKLQNAKYIGTAFGLYAMMELNGELYALDTHAAHERVLYEKYLTAFNSRSVIKQELLISEIISLGVSQYSVMIENQDLLEQAGFEIDEYPNHCVALRSIPYYLAGCDDIAYLIEQIAEELLRFNKNTDIGARNDTLIKKACHNAFRGSSNISEAEIRKLFSDLYKAKTPFTCPHGRPVIGRLTEKVFMKAFERL